ncbi:hypothetical protein Noda2021_01390 [Candidatus Dependentiae bacterium Noda2021]|nr:hypothetical protein Noda2021_01390 [Candidatus Dependentiae bacterium Noda2021]
MKYIITFFLTLCTATTFISGTDNVSTKRYFNKSISELRAEYSLLDTALSKTQWSLIFFNVKALFIKPSHTECLRLNNYRMLFEDIAHKIGHEIYRAQQELANNNEKPTLLGDGTNPGLEIAANVLFFPFIMASELQKNKKIETNKKAIKKMQSTKKYLETMAYKLRKLIAPYHERIS